MKLTLLDYQGKKKDVEIGELKDIHRITIDVISGDEVAVVLYNDYKTAKFDSSNNRRINYPYGVYVIYDVDENVELINNEEWKNRKDSYDGMFTTYDDEEYEEVES